MRPSLDGGVELGHEPLEARKCDRAALWLTEIVRMFGRRQSMFEEARHHFVGAVLA